MLCGVCRGTKGRLMPNTKDKMLLEGVILLEYKGKLKGPLRYPPYGIPAVLETFLFSLSTYLEQR